ncbi:MAG: SCO family protein [Acidobacteria bacterium]|nr:SCO family protein [Acidobacteriota bacterium]
MVRLCLTAVALLLASSCSRAPEPRRYELHGQILGIDRDRREVLVDHEDIKGFMPAMTMPYKVSDPAMLDGRQPGDLITATLVVEEVQAYLSAMATTGHAPIRAGAAGPSITDADLLKEGEAVPGGAFVDETGAAFPLASLRGHRVALTFIYTRCPLPDFCPLMDRHFAAVQRQIGASANLADVRLVSVTLDPGFDTPAVLRAHAKAAGANPRLWHFATGSRDDVLAFARRFGVLTEPGESEGVVVHNLRTAIIDAEGRLASVRSGNMWTPADLVADLEQASAPAR